MKKLLLNLYLLVSFTLITNICFAYTENKPNNFQQNSFNEIKKQPQKPPIKNETMGWVKISGSMVLLIVGNIAFWGYIIVKSTKKEIKANN